MYSTEITDIDVQLTKSVYQRSDLYILLKLHYELDRLWFLSFPPISAHVFKTIQIILNYVCIYTKP